MRTPSRPRVQATYEHEAVTISNAAGDTWTPPGISLEISFDLHDHEGALRLLEAAVGNVVAQIEDTRGAP